jgi:hypothetical protein
VQAGREAELKVCMLRRKRIIYAGLLLLVILTGLASRSHSLQLSHFVKEYAGDTLWALAVYLMIAVLATGMHIRKVAVIAGLISLSIEVSQLYHAPWIDQIRHTRLGGLVLGFGFLWSDLLCYAVGIGIGVLLESCGMALIFSGRRPRSA